MKVFPILTFLLVANSKANALHSFATYERTPTDEYGVVSLWDVISNIIGTAARTVRVFFPVEVENKDYTCLILNAFYRGAMLKYPDLPTTLSTRTLNALDKCSTRDIQVADSFSQLLIFPGTNWCGQENIARSYNDLGKFNKTDSCCREHDYCDDVIRPGRAKHNLFNPYKTVRLHCKCDEAFRKCLKKANTTVSKIIGYLFFSLLQTQCFDFDNPAKCVAWNRGAVKLYCVEYQYDDDQPKKWQWFDKEPYV